MGAGFALWAFRAAATGHSQCHVLVRGYEEALGREGPAALGAVSALAWVIGRDGGRRIIHPPPGCCRVTADELSIVAALSATQEGDDARRDAHMCWLMCGRFEIPARQALRTVGDIFQCAGITITRPPLEISQPAAGQ